MVSIALAQQRCEARQVRHRRRCRRAHVGQLRQHARGWRGEEGRGLDQIALNATRAGIARNRIVLDPGFGFGKRLEENYPLLARLEELAYTAAVNESLNPGAET